MKRVCEHCGSEIEIKFSPIPDFGDLFTMEEFLEHIDKGWFISYDGTGYYAFEDKESDFVFDIDNYKYFKKYDKRFTHVMWYNR